MTKSSTRLMVATIATIFTALSILMPISASAASNKKCFKGWAYGYHKNGGAAIRLAQIAWQAKAQSILATSSATWGRASNRQVNLKVVVKNGQPTRRGSAYAEYCKINTPGAKRNSAAGRGPRLPMARRR